MSEENRNPKRLKRPVSGMSGGEENVGTAPVEEATKKKRSKIMELLSHEGASSASEEMPLYESASSISEDVLSIKSSSSMSVDMLSNKSGSSLSVDMLSNKSGSSLSAEMMDYESARTSETGSVQEAMDIVGLSGSDISKMDVDSMSTASSRDSESTITDAENPEMSKLLAQEAYDSSSTPIPSSASSETESADSDDQSPEGAATD